MNLWQDVSPEMKKSIIRWTISFGLFTLFSSIAIGMAGGLLIADLGQTERGGKK